MIILKLSNNFEISIVVCIPNITYTPWYYFFLQVNIREIATTVGVILSD